MKNIITILILLMSYTCGLSQLSGVITDEKGDVLPFASVYVKNSSLGTTSNQDGEYSLQISQGTYEVVFQYVGYEQQIKTITISETKTLNVQLAKLNVNLGEVTVTADSEDPAYPIIRKAMSKRKYYLNQVKKYTCDTYIKGYQKIEEVPEEILGMEIGDLGGILDSTRSGVIYLSESISKLHFQAPNQYHEEMISSKVSGDDNGFSFNNAAIFNFNFYNNIYSELPGAGVISPIANNAFSYYKYKLKGAFLDESGQLVNKIEVIRKRDTDPTISGYIYINEDLWNIHSIDFLADSKTLANDTFDSISIKLLNIPLENDVWLPLSSSLDFQFHILGIKSSGRFTGMFSQYNLNPPSTQILKNEVFTVQKDANKKDSSYWKEVRPIPLTQEEINDYQKKDSLQVIWNSKEYKDSLDRKNNRFRVLNLLLGYTYSNRHKNWSLTFNTPLFSIGYNTVQGYYPNLDISYKKTLDPQKNRFWQLGLYSLYGFSDKQYRGKIDATYHFNNTNQAEIQLQGGRMASQFNGGKALDESLNTSLSMMYRLNYAKYYDKYFGKVKFSSEISNGLYLNSSLEYADRTALKNTSNHSWFYNKSRVFTSNHPLDSSNPEDSPFFDRHQALTMTLDFTFRFRQKYMSYPNRKIVLGSDYPTLRLRYKKGIKALGTKSNYDFLSLSIKDDIKTGSWGVFSYRAESGMFLNKTQVPFIDFHHFMGQRTGAYMTQKSLEQFRALPYYKHSTTAPYALLQWEHSFKGFLLGKIPLIRHLQGHLVIGNNLLYSESTKWYSEWVIGIDAFRPFRNFRFDFITQFQKGQKKPEFRFMLGVKI